MPYAVLEKEIERLDETSIVKLARGNARERALYASNTPPPSLLDGHNVDGLTRRMRRVGRLSPKQYRNLTGRRVFTLGPMVWFSFRSVIRFSRRDAEAQRRVGFGCGQAKRPKG